MRHVSVQQLSAFVDGALVGVSRELVTRHLTACGGCRERLVRWNANDVALRRVLAWEPDERTLEEWSSRVEMTITAERKGLPPPEFTELLHPVISHAPGIDGERLNNAVQSASRARKGEPAPAPQASAPAPAPNPATTPAVSPPAPKPTPSPERAAASVVPSAAAKPAAAVSPPASKPEAIASPAVAPAAATEGRKPMPEPALAAPPAIVASEPPPKPVHAPAPAPVDAHAPAAGHVPPWSEVSLPAAESGPEPAGPARYASLRTYEPAPHRTESYATYAERRPHWRDRLEERRPLLLALTAVLLLVLAGSPLAPEVIRIPLPEHWSWRLPRVEFVRRGLEKMIPPPVDDAANRFAVRVAAEPEIVPPKPIPPPVDSTPAADTAAVQVKAAEPVAQSSLSITEPRPAPKRAPKPAKKKAPPPEPEPEPEVLTWPESPGTFVPTRVTTSVQASPAPSRPASSPASEVPVPGPVESEAEWPLLCGTVFDGAGVPFEGALVVLTGNALSVRTDRRGRFCVACPPGTQGIRVEASGQQPFTRTVELKSGMVEISVSLTPDQ